IKRREDWRSKPVMTIDPFDAKDFDDAVHVTRLPGNKGWELAVHIADVSHYVTPGSALDKEARSRGNSTYLVDRVIPMLPESLSNGICSLKANVDRLTRVVVMKFASDGTMTSSRFASAVINSKHRLTYEQAYAILIGQTDAAPVVPVPKNYKHPSHAPAPPQDTALTKHLATAWELASTLRKRRFNKGSLDLDFPEVKVHVDRDTGNATKLERIEYDESHQMIEEFMLVANEAVAKRIQDSSKPAIYRIHDDPDPAKLFEFAELARAHGIRTGDLTLKGEIQKLLGAIRGNAEEHALKVSLLKSLKRAAYSTNPVGHFGLAKKHYTHFTSPIRRYADLIVHRVLDGIVAPDRQTAKLPKQVQMAEICEHISTTERNSSDAETQSVRLKELEYLDERSRQDHQPAMAAVINEVRPIGLFVELSEYMIRGLVHRDTLGGGPDLRFESAQNSFNDARGRPAYKAGQTIDVYVDRVDFERLRVDFKPA
ncbi:MAG: VacB/RNase II family 3'-5' exoribonuclease, partial [Verrucomicrobiales bacterium]|nr:VacB/RNase II family 3'-5' exoribonuclease [Verrucomicrobiales bacterium]